MRVGFEIQVNKRQELDNPTVRQKAGKTREHLAALADQRATTDQVKDGSSKKSRVANQGQGRIGRWGSKD